ncbi:hypothetical protein [Erythrobacter sp.]|uniref:hypothetical protein n=1 Tax=Erythrobacter sp. TaxID=1042 RepID=UPI001425D49C|nr:hypothetical protein [Erythrobacter sp.]QIQ86317.1 MAG: hypothetical protein G9473_06170 [Erythrobacter sp.]
MTRPAFRINPALDPEALAREFARAGRVHIPDFLVAEDAERLLDHLKAAEEEWRLVINAGEKLFELDRKTQGEMDEGQREALDQAVNAQARAGFQFR